MIGRTANIVALGMLEKKAPHQMGFFAWLKVGALSALLAGGVVWIGLVVTSPFMPDRVSRVGFEQLAGNFDGKEVDISAVYGAPATAPDEFEVVMSDTLAFRLDPEKGGSPVRLVAVVSSAWIGKSGVQPGESGVFRGRLYSGRTPDQESVLYVSEISGVK